LFIAIVAFVENSGLDKRRLAATTAAAAAAAKET
jgi:hypothetical protein